MLPPAPLSTLRCVYWFSCERALFQLPCCCKLARTAAARQTVTEAAVCSKGLVLVAHRTTALPPVYNVGRSQGGTWRSQVHLHRMPRRRAIAQRPPLHKFCTRSRPQCPSLGACNKEDPSRGASVHEPGSRSSVVSHTCPPDAVAGPQQRSPRRRGRHIASGVHDAAPPSLSSLSALGKSGPGRARRRLPDHDK